MNAKEYLRQARWKDAKINALIHRLEHYRDMATRCTPAYSDTGGVSGSSGTGRDDYICKIVELDRQINAQIDAYVDLVRDVEALIDSLPDDRHREILRWRYLSGWDWNKIGREMNYSSDWVRHLHGYALLEAEKAFKMRHEKTFET